LKGFPSPLTCHVVLPYFTLPCGPCLVLSAGPHIFVTSASAQRGHLLNT
jgi:hypothetical protein